ncbi:hypothetical protein GCM10009007_11360 [Formosimonas limnophila]|uniref:Uncharacterized protein n=1 Tax=Formosimonas limnophila TaxID=1384487 RepID=A0A8J3CN28_9BURK|nr:hypothetical protein GCM10009007_11360 [Formosimonas limnophila]
MPTANTANAACKATANHIIDTFIIEEITIRAPLRKILRIVQAACEHVNVQFPKFMIKLDNYFTIALASFFCVGILHSLRDIAKSLNTWGG